MEASMRSTLALAASGLTSAAAVVSALDRGPDELAFFSVLTVAGVVASGALLPAFAAPGRLLARLIAVVWATAGGWIGALLVMFQVACGCSMPTPTPEATYLGLTATTYHLVAMYASTVLIVVAAFGRSALLDRPVGRSRNLG
jgi:hypothetical protein